MAPHTQERADRGHLLNVVISVDIRKREIRHYILDTHTHCNQEKTNTSLLS